MTAGAVASVRYHAGAKHRPDSMAYAISAKQETPIGMMRFKLGACLDADNSAATRFRLYAVHPHEASRFPRTLRNLLAASRKQVSVVDQSMQASVTDTP